MISQATLRSYKGNESSLSSLTSLVLEYALRDLITEQFGEVGHYPFAGGGITETKRDSQLFVLRIDYKI